MEILNNYGACNYKNTTYYKQYKFGSNILRFNYYI